ncbi:MAG TPA: orotidine-5'-phosphate decarboxylase [Thermoanaerobaculia bacterium]|nr:orotidine-5'-phosphate decarboxylase [Thermoanaerobaculia bacterium]
MAEPNSELNADPILLSTKTIPPEERLIFALDVPGADEAKRLVTTLREAVEFYKVGLELFLDAGFELVDWILEQEKKVFLDLKLFDVPETVRRAVRQISRRPVTFTTVHAGSRSILEAAAAEKGEVKILAVTVLTSLDKGDLNELGADASDIDVERLVLSRARRALEAGCDGVIASGLEAAPLRRELGGELHIVTPGIRPAENRPADDQKRVVTVEQALLNGADYIVVGRPIRDAADPYQAALDIQGSIEGLFVSG